MAQISIVIPDGSIEKKCDRLFDRAGLKLELVSERQKLYSVKDRRISSVRKRRPQEIPIMIARELVDVAIATDDWILENYLMFRNRSKDLVSPFCDIHMEWWKNKRYPSIIKPVEVGMDLGKMKYEVLLRIPFSRRSDKPVRIVAAVAKDTDYDSIYDLPDHFTVASEYPWLALEYFKQHFGRKKQFYVMRSYGNTEQKILDGLAEIIIEATETGHSLKENRLRVIDEIIKSYPVVVAGSKLEEDEERKSTAWWFVSQLEVGIEKLGIKIDPLDSISERLLRSLRGF